MRARRLAAAVLVVLAGAGSGAGRLPTVLSAGALAEAEALAEVGAQEDVLARIRHEGMDRSKVQALFATLTDQFGPCLAGTPAYKQSAEWARDRMREFGLGDPRLDPFPFGRGWVLDRLVIEQDLKQNAVVMAWFAWQAATTAERIPRP